MGNTLFSRHRPTAKSAELTAFEEFQKRQLRGRGAGAFIVFGIATWSHFIGSGAPPLHGTKAVLEITFGALCIAFGVWHGLPVWKESQLVSRRYKSQVEAEAAATQAFLAAPSTTTPLSESN